MSEETKDQGEIIVRREYYDSLVAKAAERDAMMAKAYMYALEMDKAIAEARQYAAKRDEANARAERAEAALESYAEFYDRAAGLCGLPDALPSSETDLIILTRLAEHDEIEVQRARAERAEADAERLAEVLRRFEWSFRSRIFGLVCPECANSSSDKHAADCSIGTAISAHEARKGGEG